VPARGWVRRVAFTVRCMTGEVSPRGRDQMRTSYEDREAYAERLRVAAGDGRLSADELDERLERALTARTYAELEAVVTDLPDPASGALGAVAAAGVPFETKDLVRIERKDGSVKQTGRWVVPRRMELKIRDGSARLDLTQAIVSESRLDVDVAMRDGSLVFVVPPGVLVDADEVKLRDGSVRHREGWLPEAPVRLHVRVTGELRDGSVVVKGPPRPRRSFLGWLLRRPRPTGLELPR
jgi:hypothetical protein